MEGPVRFTALLRGDSGLRRHNFHKIALCDVQHVSQLDGHEQLAWLHPLAEMQDCHVRLAARLPQDDFLEVFYALSNSN